MSNDYVVNKARAQCDELYAKEMRDKCREVVDKVAAAQDKTDDKFVYAFRIDGVGIPITSPDNFMFLAAPVIEHVNWDRRNHTTIRTAPNAIVLSFAKQREILSGKSEPANNQVVSLKTIHELRDEVCVGKVKKEAENESDDNSYLGTKECQSFTDKIEGLLKKSCGKDENCLKKVGERKLEPNETVLEASLSSDEYSKYLLLLIDRPEWVFSSIPEMEEFGSDLSLQKKRELPFGLFAGAVNYNVPNKYSVFGFGMGVDIQAYKKFYVSPLLSIAFTGSKLFEGETKHVTDTRTGEFTTTKEKGAGLLSGGIDLGYMLDVTDTSSIMAKIGAYYTWLDPQGFDSPARFPKIFRGQLEYRLPFIDQKGQLGTSVSVGGGAICGVIDDSCEPLVTSALNIFAGFH